MFINEHNNKGHKQQINDCKRCSRSRSHCCIAQVVMATLYVAVFPLLFAVFVRARCRLVTIFGKNFCVSVLVVVFDLVLFDANFFHRRRTVEYFQHRFAFFPGFVRKTRVAFQALNEARRCKTTTTIIIIIIIKTLLSTFHTNLNRRCIWLKK